MEKTPWSVSTRSLIVASSILLGALLLASRWLILQDTQPHLNLFAAAGVLLRAVAADWALVWFLAIVFLWRIERSRKARIWAWSFLALTLVLAAAGLGNVQSVKMLGGPVTLQWLHFADIFNSTYMVGIVLGSLSPSLLGLAVLGVAAWVLVVLALALVLDRGHSRRYDGPGRLLYSLLPAVTLSLIAVGSPDLGGRAQNPVVTLVTSFVLPDRTALNLDANLGVADPVAPVSFADILATVPALPRPKVPEGAIRNVLIYVMESTRATYVHGYGPDLGLTPVIASLADKAIKVTDAYAHAPASGYGRASIFGGVIPEIRSANLHHLYPDLKLDGLARVLGRHGYRTGYFSTTDNRFQGNGELVRSTGFDMVSDLYTWGTCEHALRPRNLTTDDFLDTVNDRCAIGPLLDWIDHEPQAPFLAAIWTGMTHYPYYPGPELRPLADEETKNRYMNGVQVMDQALGDLVAGLESRGLLDETLIVVVGDHGEAFGEHGQHGHATDIYEENLHVPMYFVHAGLFSGETADRIAGLIDIAPTVADLLDIPASPDWHGQSLFAPQRLDGTLFFAAWNDLQIGYREGTVKLVINANTGTSRLHDLAIDPDERVNLADSNPELLTSARLKLAKLVKAHAARITELVAPSDVAEATAPTESDRVTLRLGGTWFRQVPRVKVRLDGAELDELNVESAVSNRFENIDLRDILDSATDFSIDVVPGRCPRRLEIEFINDDWAGEGLSGDNNVFLRRVALGGKTYWPLQFEVDPSTAGYSAKEAGYLYRDGVIGLNLELSPDCIAADLRDGSVARIP